MSKLQVFILSFIFGVLAGQLWAYMQNRNRVIYMQYEMNKYAIQTVEEFIDFNFPKQKGEARIFRDWKIRRIR